MVYVFDCVPVTVYVVYVVGECDDEGDGGGGGDSDGSGSSSMSKMAGKQFVCGM